MKFGTLIAIALLCAAPAAFAGSYGKTTEMKTSGAIEVKDVEALNDNLPRYKDKKVTVSGEVQKLVDSKTMVLESGGIFDDEVVVLMGPQMKEETLSKFSEDKEVKVTGTLKMLTPAQAEKQYGWTPPARVTERVKNQRAFIVADQIALMEEGE